MSIRYLAAVASLLLGSSIAIAQAQITPAPNIEPEPGPLPTPIGSTSEYPGPSPLFEVYGQPPTIFTVDLEYLLWFLANSHDSTVIASTDLLSNPGVGVLGVIGNAEHASRRPTSGARLSLGYWQIEPNAWNPGAIRDFGGELTFFVLGQRGVDFRNGPNPNLVRPFFDLNNRQESGFIVAAPGLATGIITGHAQAELWGAEANVWKNIYYKCPGTTCSLAMLAGLRFLSADHRIQIDSTTIYDPNLPPASPFFALAGNRLDVSDSFSTRNRFYGGQVGISSKCWPVPRFCFETIFKLALGVTCEELNIAGSQLRTQPNSAKTSSTGGLLALPSNIGSFQNNRFAQVPEIDCKLSYEVTDNITLSGGFSALYWSRIARAGTQIDRQLDITQIPNFPVPAGTTPTGLGRPGVFFEQSDLWALGLSLGVEVKW